MATISEIRAAGIAVHHNANSYGIPQGTPISSALSNLYMIDLDATLAPYCKSIGGLYRRYSDDILIVCPVSLASTVETFVKQSVSAEKLEINDTKTERHVFDLNETEHGQYLGFTLSPDSATIRQSALARQWRKLKKSVKRIRKVGEQAIAEGKADKIYTKKLRRRFTPVPVRNFSSYARRSAAALNSPKIIRQVRRLERYIENELAGFKKPKNTE